MKQPNFYPHAFVPPHMAKLTVERIPYDTPYYLSGGGDSDFDEPTFFINENNRLAIGKSHEIDADDRRPSIPLGRIGIMKSLMMAEATPKDIFVADLRFLENHHLPNWPDRLASAYDQEERMYLLTMSENAVAFDAFIASEENGKIDKHDLPESAFYGDVSLHSSLHLLRKSGNHTMKAYIRAQKAAEEAARQKAAEKKKTRAQ